VWNINYLHVVVQSECAARFIDLITCWLLLRDLVALTGGLSLTGY
jgi:hypothetical protein